MTNESENWRRAKESFSLGLYALRLALAEWLMVLAMDIMPPGPERAELNKHLYNYYLWTKENGA